MMDPRERASFAAALTESFAAGTVMPAGWDISSENAIACAPRAHGEPIPDDESVIKDMIVESIGFDILDKLVLSRLTIQGPAWLDQPSAAVDTLAADEGLSFERTGRTDSL